MKPGRVAFANTAGINLSHCYTAIKAAHKERLLWIIPRLSMPTAASRVRRLRLIPLTEPYIRATYTAHAINLPRTRGR